MSDVAAARLSSAPLRFVYQRHAAKRIAGRFGVAFWTAVDWLRVGVPKEREDEWRAAILAELDALEAEIARQRAEVEKR